jgi:hypothetical protein
MSNTNIFSAETLKTLEEMGNNQALYADYLKYQGKISKQPTHAALDFYSQNPTNEPFFATRGQWEKVGYTIANGAMGKSIIDNNGNQRVYFDVSETDQKVSPVIWQLNAENQNAVRAEFGIPENGNILGGIMAQLQDDEMIEYTAKQFRVPPQYYRQFKQSYLQAVAAIIAGRLEVGGNNFDIQPDMTVLNVTHNPTERLALLGQFRTSANKVINRVQKAVERYNSEKNFEREQNERTYLGEMAQSDGRGTAENTAVDIDTIEDRSAENRTPQFTSLFANGDTGRNGGVESDEKESGEQSMVSRVSTAGTPENGGEILDEVGRNLGSVPPDVAIRAEFDGRTVGEIRDGVAHDDVGEVSTNGGDIDVAGVVSDDSTLGGQSGVGNEGDTRNGVSGSEPLPEQLYGQRSVLSTDGVGNRQPSDEGNSPQTANRAVDGGLHNIGAEPEIDDELLQKLSAELDIETDTDTPETSPEYENSDEVFLYETETEFSEIQMTENEQFVALKEEIEGAKILVNNILWKNDLQKKDMENVATIRETIAGLEQQGEMLYEFLREQNITYDDILFVREQIPSYTSLMNLTEPQKAAVAKLEKLFDNLGELSPFMRRKNDTLSDSESEQGKKRIPVVELRDYYPSASINTLDETYKQIKASRKELKTSIVGAVKNDHSNWDIDISPVTFNETYNSAVQKYGRLKSQIERNEKALQIASTNSQYKPEIKDVSENDVNDVLVQFEALNQIQELAKNAALLNSVIPDMHGGKSTGSMFMHYLYAPLNFRGQSYVAKLEVEHYYDTRSSETGEEIKKRLYCVKGIKIAPLTVPLLGLPQRGSSQATVLSADVSIAELRGFVKGFDKDYFENFVNLSLPKAEIRDNGRGNKVAEDYIHAEYTDNERIISEIEGRETDGQTFPEIVEALSQTTAERPEEQAVINHYAETYNTTAEQAKKSVKQLVEERLKETPIISERRAEILAEFADKYGLPNLIVYKAEKVADGYIRSYSLGVKQGGKYFANVPLFDIKKGEVFSENKLTQALETFWLSERFEEVKKALNDTAKKPNIYGFSTHEPKDEWLQNYFRDDNPDTYFERVASFETSIAPSENQQVYFKRYLREAGIIDDKNRITELGQAVKANGWDSRDSQAIMYINLCFNSPQFAWYAQNIGVNDSRADLITALRNPPYSQSERQSNGIVGSLITLAKSQLGQSANFCEATVDNKFSKHAVDFDSPVVFAYAVYKFAEQATKRTGHNQNEFRLSNLLENRRDDGVLSVGEVLGRGNSAYDLGELQKYCNGLTATHNDIWNSTFTNDLDKISLKGNINDVVKVFASQGKKPTVVHDDLTQEGSLPETSEQPETPEPTQGEITEPTVADVPLDDDPFYVSPELYAEVLELIKPTPIDYSKVTGYKCEVETDELSALLAGKPDNKYLLKTTLYFDNGDTQISKQEVGNNKKIAERYRKI